MENIKIIEVETAVDKREFVIIDRGNNEFTSMPKAIWDELEAQREQSGTL